MADEKTYVSDIPRLMEEWNWEKNVGIDPKQITVGVNWKVWWKCSKGHEWQASPNHRNNGRGCPYCSNRRVLKGYNDLETVNPTVAKEWVYEKNGGLKPYDVTANSHKKVCWKCSQGHEWEAVIHSRNKGIGCPYCAGQKVLQGFNDLQTLNPILAEEWNYERNGNLTPLNVRPGSEKKVWWKCKKEHEWQATIASRNSGRGCPYCSGYKVLKGYNDLQTVNPILAEEWNYERNGNLTPLNVRPGSEKKVWWKCKNGHEWQATIASRNSGNGCPYCAGQRVIKGYNDLYTVNPALAEEWNCEKNGELTPSDVFPNSNKKFWWRCSKGHEWQTTINHRTNGNGCPICSSERKTSFPEYAIVYYLEKYGIEAIHLYKEKGYELDVYIPAKKVAIEYDGCLWHKNKAKKDLDKNLKCSRDGIKLYRLREGLPPLNDSSLDYIVQKDKKDLSEVLEKVLSEIIGASVDIDLERDEVDIESLRELTEKNNSLLLSNPEIASEWCYEKNGSLRPEHFAANSSKKVWWMCSKGHEWKAVISSRNKGHGCPYCSGQKVIKDFNDLQTLNPTLAAEWNCEKNGNLTPSDVMLGSNQKMWWKCSKEHEWQAKIGDRNKGQGCPYCAGVKVLKGYNDLQTLNPDLAAEWNYEKNGNLTPMDVTPGSDKKVWWKCSKGHEWQAIIGSRNKGRGCPYCAGRKVLKGYNDLETINPALAKEWNYEQNGNLIPENFTANSHTKVWWKCSKGHEWQAEIKSRNAGCGCPECAKEKRKAKKG